MLGYGDEKTEKMDGKIIRAKGGKEIKRMKKKFTIAVIFDVLCSHALVVVEGNDVKCVQESSGKT
jgi:hypothetical protein